MNLKDPQEYYQHRFENPIQYLIQKQYKNIISLETLQIKINKNRLNLESKDIFSELSTILMTELNKNNYLSSLMGGYFQYKALKINHQDLSKEHEELKAIHHLINDMDPEIELKDSLVKFYELAVELKNIEHKEYFLKDLLYILINTILFKNDNWQRLQKRGGSKNKKLSFLTKYHKNFLYKFRGYFLIKTSNKKLNNTSLLKKIFKEVPILRKLNTCYFESNHSEIQNIILKKPFLLRYQFPLLKFNTIFHLAIEDQKLDLVKLLIEIDPRCINLTNKEGMTPLFTAIRTSNLEIINMLITKGSQLNERDKKKNNLIYTSIMFSEDHITKFLIDKGCDVNNQNYLGRTPLMKTIYLCKKKKTQYLIEHDDININLQDQNGRTAVHMACWGNEGGRNGKKVQNIVFEEFSEGLELLLKKAPKLDLKDRDGNTAVLVSCSTNALNCVKIWAEQKANFNTINNYGENALLISVRYGNYDVIKYLLDNTDVKQDLVNCVGDNSLMICALYNHNDILELLLTRNIVSFIDFVYSSLDYFLTDSIKMNIFLKVLFSSKKDNIDYLFKVLTSNNIETFIKVSSDLISEEEQRFFSLLITNKIDFKDKILLISFKFSKIELILFVAKYLKNELKEIFNLISKEMFDEINFGVLKKTEIADLILENVSFEFILGYKNKTNRTFFMLLIEEKLIEIFNQYLFIIQKENIYKERLKTNLKLRDDFDLSIHDLTIKQQNYWIMNMIDDFVNEDKNENKKIKFIKCQINELGVMKDEELSYLKQDPVSKIDFQIFSKIKDNAQIKKISEFLSEKSCSEFYQLNLSDLNITIEFVENEEDCEKAFKSISNHNLIGIDYEYDQADYEDKKIKTINLLQISVEEKVYIFDCYKIYEEIKPRIKELMDNDKILKLVHGCYYDLKLLFSFFQARKVFFIDLAEAYKSYFKFNQNIGLSKLSKKFLDFELDKSLQCSNWNMRPLPIILLKYAAIDAFILLPLFQKFLKINCGEEILRLVLEKSQNIYKKFKTLEKVLSIQIQQNN